VDLFSAMKQNNKRSMCSMRSMRSMCGGKGKKARNKSVTLLIRPRNLVGDIEYPGQGKR
jgi:hypothetical protein